MKQRLVCPLVVAFAVVAGAGSARAASADLDALVARFEAHAGVALVFTESDMPKGSYHDVMNELTTARRVAATRIALREVEKYPRGFLSGAGLRAVGIFDSLVSRTGDGFRPYNKRHKGYLYYGLWNGNNALVAAYYTDGQLPLTLHHEIFHHLDATRAGTTDYAKLFAADDKRFARAVSGKQRYPAPRLDAEDLAALKKRSKGHLLRTAVSEYAAKSAGEDQAETARFFMTSLPDALVQIVERPELAGSQRILHVLAQYRRATVDGPDLDWFVDVALGRSAATERARRLFVARAERALRTMRERIRPTRNDTAFSVWGGEDESGINWTLRSDVWRFGRDAAVLAEQAALAPGSDATLTRAELRSLRLLSRYYRYIDSRWTVTRGTLSYFQWARTQMQNALPASKATLRAELGRASFARLASAISADGRVTGSLSGEGALPRNRYSHKVDAAIGDSRTRAALRRAQPAAVRLGNGSGVNIDARGRILTAAHVVGKLGAKMTARFPDGRRVTAECTAIDLELDLAILTVARDEGVLPSAALAPGAPAVGDRVIAIGQPGTSTPGGKPTGYQPFHVSVGKIGIPTGSPRAPAPRPHQARRLDLLGALGQPDIRHLREHRRCAQQLGLEHRDAPRRYLRGHPPLPRRKPHPIPSHGLPGQGTSGVRHARLLCSAGTGMWLRQFIERALDRPGSDRFQAQVSRVDDVLYKRSLYDSADEFVDALLAQLPVTESLDNAALARIIHKLRGPRGDAASEIDEAHEALLRFWATLARRFPDNAGAVACYGDALLIAERRAEAMGWFLAAFALEPSLFDEFGDELEPVARELGGQAWLDYQLCALRARIEGGSGSAEEDDLVRERYSELLDEYRGDDEALGHIREIGKRIGELTAENKLPRAMMRRSSPRPKAG